MSNNEHIRTKPEDGNFHSQRRMFVLKEGQLVLAQEDSTLSHIEWFEAEGWVAPETASDFLSQNVRGFYLPSDNALYFYKGNGFFFDGGTEQTVLQSLEALKESLHLNAETKIFLGPRDLVVNGREYAQKYLGTLSTLETH